MQLEVKLVLGQRSDYERIIAKLADLYIGEECHEDYFFDFPEHTLSNHSKVLRLRILQPSTTVEPNCNQSPPAEQKPVDLLSQPYGTLESWLHTGPTHGHSGNVGDYEQSPTALVSGKLVLKSNNSVECGDQTAFTTKDSIPPHVTQSLVNGVEDAFVVLQKYASTAPTSGTASIVEKLMAIAEEYRAGNDDNDDVSALHNSQYEFSQIRYAVAGGSNTSMSTQSTPLSLVSMGNYRTVRRTYSFFRGTARTGGVDLSDWRDRLRLHLDCTIYPFGEHFELEASEIDDAPLDEVHKELQDFLAAVKVNYMNGTEGKYARFVRRMKPLRTSEQLVQDIKLKLINAEGYKEMRRSMDIMMAEQCGSTSGKRCISNTDINTSGLPADDDLPILNNGSEEVTDWYFDGADRQLLKLRCSLRLRQHGGGLRFTLVLKEDRKYESGQQTDVRTTLELSADEARRLLHDPTTYLISANTYCVICQKLSMFGVPCLEMIACFKTERFSAPWLAAKSQVSTPVRPLSTSYTQGRSQVVAAITAAKALHLHLDRTTYCSGNQTCVVYEIEVTNILSDPMEVMSELQYVLNQRGVEWAAASPSKLAQYFDLIGCNMERQWDYSLPRTFVDEDATKRVGVGPSAPSRVPFSHLK